MAKIGLRNIKTAISVFICMMIYFIIAVIAHIFNASWVSNFKIATQLYTPFFACIATAYSLSTSKEKSLEQGYLRLGASLIGGLFGLLVVSLYQLTGHDWPFQHISATGNPTYDGSGLFESGFLGGEQFSKENVDLQFVLSFIIPIILIGLSVVVVIWFCNLIKKPQCSFIAVLTLTAVMASLGTNPVIYGPNRILSTVIGILVALGVNMFSLPHYKNKNKTFIFGIDGVYTKDFEKFNGYNQYMMSKLIADGADIHLFTTRTPSSFKPMLGEVMPANPIICMSGAACYDFKNEHYVFKNNIPNKISTKMTKIFDELKVSPFVNVIRNDVLYTYSASLDNPGEEIYANKRKNAPYIAFDLVDEAPSKDVLYYLVIDTKEKIKKIEAKLKEKDVINDLLLLTYDVYERDEKNNGYSYLKIYSKEIANFPYLKTLNKEEDNVIGVGVHNYDFVFLENVKTAITSSLASDNIQKSATLVLNDKKKDHSVLFKEILKIFHTKD